MGYWSCFIPCTEIGKNLGIYCFLGSLASSPQVGTNSEGKTHVSELSVGSGFRLALKPEITSLLGFFVSPSCSQDQSPLFKCYEELRISRWGQQSIAQARDPADWCVLCDITGHTPMMLALAAIPNSLGNTS